MIEVGDKVKVNGIIGAWTVVEARSDGLFKIQLSNDTATAKYIQGAQLELMRKAKRSSEFDFHSDRSFLP